MLCVPQVIHTGAIVHCTVYRRHAYTLESQMNLSGRQVPSRIITAPEKNFDRNDKENRLRKYAHFERNKRKNPNEQQRIMCHCWGMSNEIKL